MCGTFPTPYGEHKTSKKGKGMVPGLKELMLCMNPERKLPENKTQAAVVCEGDVHA